MFEHGDGGDAREAFIRSQQVVNQRAWLGNEGHGAVSLCHHAVQREVGRRQANDVFGVWGSPERGRFELVFDSFEALIPAALCVRRGVGSERSVTPAAARTRS